MTEECKNKALVKRASVYLKAFTDHLDKQYGKRCTNSREKHEQETEAFKHGVKL